MTRPLEPGEPALLKYNELYFSFVDIGAGEAHLLTNDAWSFVSSHLQASRPKRRGAKQAAIDKALYFAAQAEDFYRAAETVPLPARATLLYYGMLNLVKCFLSTRGVPLETIHETHGMSLVLGKQQIVEAKPPTKDAINIFASFCEQLGGSIKSRCEIGFVDTLSHVPEVHSICFSLGQVTKRKLLPVTIEFQVNAAHDKLFTELVYDKEHEAKVDAARFLTGKRRAYFRDGLSRPQKVVYRAARRKSYTKANMDRIYRHILAEYRSLDVVPILTARGYRYYVDLKPGDFPHLGHSLLGMFYLGSAARYRPSEMQTLLTGRSRPLVSEFVSLTPRQFLYQLTSIITGRECVIPYAAI